MRYLNTLSKTECLKPIGLIPVHILAVSNNHPFFSPIDLNTHYWYWTEGEQPELVAYTEEELTAKEELIAQATKKTYTPKQFMERFTPGELVDIYTHAESVIETRIWVDRLLSSTYVDLSDVALLNGMAYLVYQGLITQERYDLIMI